MEKDKFIVIRDTREKENNGWFFDETEFCSGTEVIGLHTGDYSIKGLEDLFIIERKASTGEFSHNTIEDRFEKELERLNSIKHAFVILEFNLSDIYLFPNNSGIPRFKWNFIKIKPQFILKRLNEFTLKYPNVKFVFVGAEAKWYVEDLMKRIFLMYKDKLCQI